MTDTTDTEWKPYFAEKVLDLYDNIKDRGLHPLQGWAEMEFLINGQRRRNEDSVK